MSQIGVWPKFVASVHSILVVCGVKPWPASTVYRMGPSMRYLLSLLYQCAKLHNSGGPRPRTRLSLPFWRSLPSLLGSQTHMLGN